MTSSPATSTTTPAGSVRPGFSKTKSAASGSVLVAVLAVLVVVAASACSSAIAQTEEELAAGFNQREPSHLINLYLPDGGSGVCQQLNIIGNNCHDPSGSPTSCCFDIVPPSTEPIGPYCAAYALSLVALPQVGKGFCCAANYPNIGPHVWYRFEDQTKACDFCGGKTPGPDECCTRDRNVIPAYPVTDFSKCPDLQQDPAHQPSITTPPCGSEDMEKNLIKIPQEIGPVPFYVACGFHDECYSTCRSDKAACDSKLGADLRADCAAYWQPLLDQAQTEDEITYAQGGLSNCQNFARI